MKKRLNLIVLIAEVLCIVLMHSFKTNHSEKINQSFSQKFIDLNKFQSIKSYTISSLK
ncbi:MAG TPA: hypothetical protein VHZ50_07660 [Puia sp.]|nr:hypothetical protein [Puia sp.]